MNKTNFASEYLQHQVNDNYPRFIVTSYITALIGILFIFRNLYRSEAGLNDEFSDMYLYTWVFLVVNSILLRIALPLAKRSENINSVQQVLV